LAERQLQCFHKTRQEGKQRMESIGGKYKRICVKI